MEKENWTVVRWLEVSGFTACEIDEILEVIGETQSHVDPRVYKKMCDIAERRARDGEVLQVSTEFTTIQ